MILFTRKKSIIKLTFFFLLSHRMPLHQNLNGVRIGLSKRWSYMFNGGISKKKADAISNGVFLIGLGILIYTNAWWPGILLALWATLAVRQYLTNRIYDLAITTILLLGLFLVTFLNLNWSVLVPVLLILGGIHIIFREYCVAEGVEDENPIEETEKEIEDGSKK